MSGPWYSESGRLLLGWDSPIPAGLFLAMLVPWLVVGVPIFLWRWRRCRLALYGTGALAAGLLVLLAMTQSRGPILAMGVGLAVGWWYAGRLVETHRRVARRWCAGALVGLVLACSVVGAGARVLPDAMLTDGSVQNRLAIWRAAPGMLFQHPLGGLGAGESGYFYSQWYQSSATDYLYRGVLNSYFEMGIEHGIWLFVSLVGMALFCAMGWLMVRRDEEPGSLARSVFLAAILSLLVYALASMTSVFTDYVVLSAFAVADLMVCVGAWYRWGERKALWCMAAFAVLVSGMAALAMWGVAGRASPIEVDANADHTVELSRSAQRSGGEEATVVVDREVLGNTYGKMLRSLLEQSGRFDRFLVANPRFPLGDDVLNGRSTVILCGGGSRFLHRVSPALVRRVLIVHPATMPADLPAGVSVEVWLADGDSHGLAAGWQAWAKRVNATVRRTTALGQALPEEGVEL